MVRFPAKCRITGFDSLHQLSHGICRDRRTVHNRLLLEIQLRGRTTGSEQDDDDLQRSNRLH
jgi:hypothetical protein